MAGFLAVTGVFLWNSYRHYGNPFHDPNSKYFFWAESASEMYALQRVDAANGRPNIVAENLADQTLQKFLERWCPDAEKLKRLRDLARTQRVWLDGEFDILPNGRRYLAEHSWAQIFSRIRDGIGIVYERNAYHPNGSAKYLAILGCTALLCFGISAARWPTKAWQDIRAMTFPALFAMGSIAGSILLYAWWGWVSNRN